MIWRDARQGAPTPDAVEAALKTRFGPFLRKPPECERFDAGDVHLVFLSLPVKGFRASFVEADQEGFACSAEYPLDAGSSLTTFARRVLKDPQAALSSTAPPFAVVYAAKGAQTIEVLGDGLGQHQTFLAELEGVTAVTNKIGALGALGVPLEPEPSEWAARLFTGWFPKETSGVRGVRRLGPGERITLGRGGCVSTRSDVLSGWIHPEPMSREECIDLAQASMLGHVERAMRLCERPSVGLSGGWDSRLVTACLRDRGAEFEARVRGSELRFDVLIARELARIADFPLRVKTKSGLPPDRPNTCRAAMERALLWQAGAMPRKKHKTFLEPKGVMDGGVVNVMGQHAGIGKADFDVRIGAQARPESTWEDALIENLRKRAPEGLRPRWSRAAEELTREAYRAADRHELEGLQRLHFFFLFEYTRCWGSATVAAQSGLVLAPILNPGVIRAAYAFPSAELPSKPFHRAITDRLAPDWKGVLYESEATKADIESGRLPVPPGTRAVDKGRDPNDWRRAKRWGKYDNRLYWRDVARPLVEEALAGGGLAAELFDDSEVEAVLADPAGPDSLVLAHLFDSALVR